MLVLSCGWPVAASRTALEATSCKVSTLRPQRLARRTALLELGFNICLFFLPCFSGRKGRSLVGMHALRDINDLLHGVRSCLIDDPFHDALRRAVLVNDLAPIKDLWGRREGSLRCLHTQRWTFWRNACVCLSAPPLSDERTCTASANAFPSSETGHRD